MPVVGPTERERAAKQRCDLKVMELNAHGNRRHALEQAVVNASSRGSLDKDSMASIPDRPGSRNASASAKAMLPKSAPICAFCNFALSRAAGEGDWILLMFETRPGPSSASMRDCSRFAAKYL